MNAEIEKIQQRHDEQRKAIEKALQHEGVENFIKVSENELMDIICDKKLDVTCSASGNYPYRSEFRGRNRELVGIAFYSNSYIRKEYK